MRCWNARSGSCRVAAALCFAITICRTMNGAGAGGPWPGSHARAASAWSCLAARRRRGTGGRRFLWRAPRCGPGNGPFAARIAAGRPCPGRLVVSGFPNPVASGGQGPWPAALPPARRALTRAGNCARRDEPSRQPAAEVAALGRYRRLFALRRLARFPWILDAESPAGALRPPNEGKYHGDRGSQRGKPRRAS